MYQRIIDFIKGLSTSELERLYDDYIDVAFTFYINSEDSKYERVSNIINLIDNTLQERRVCNKN